MAVMLNVENKLMVTRAEHWKFGWIPFEVRFG